MSSSTVRDVAFALMRELGLTTMFGNPGSTEETFLKDFPKDFRYIQTLHESSAVAAADGYAQATRRPVLVNVHTAAGLSNAMSNIMTARMNKTPLIITAGNQTRDMLLTDPWLSNVDPTMLPRPWVKWSYEPVRAQDVPGAIMRAYAAALQPPAGPVFLSLPLDDWDQPANGQAAVRDVTRRVGPDPARIADFAQAILKAKNPVLIFGSDLCRSGGQGGHEGWQAAIAFAEKLNVPVWAAPASERAPFPETHPLYVGGLPFAIGPLCDKLKGHDLAVVIGAPVFRYYPYVAGDYIPQGLRLLHITDDPEEAARAPVGDSLLSDALLAVQALTPLVASRSTKTQALASQAHRMAPHPAPEEPEAADGQLSALSLFEVLHAVMPADTILVEESPSNVAQLHRAWPIETPDTFYTFASGSLGWNLPASVGLALAERDSQRNRPVLTVIGDGSFQYSVQGLWTAAQHDLPIIFVVLRNGEYAILKSFAQLENTPNVPGLDLPGLDIAALGKGYGCVSVVAKTADEVRAACEAALKRKGPTVIEVPIVPNVPPLI